MSSAYCSLSGGKEQKNYWSRADICDSGEFAKGSQRSSIMLFLWLLDIQGTKLLFDITYIGSDLANFTFVERFIIVPIYIHVKC